MLVPYTAKKNRVHLWNNWCTSPSSVHFSHVCFHRIDPVTFRESLMTCVWTFSVILQINSHSCAFVKPINAETNREWEMFSFDVFHPPWICFFNCDTTDEDCKQTWFISAVIPADLFTSCSVFANPDFNFNFDFLPCHHRILTSLAEVRMNDSNMRAFSTAPAVSLVETWKKREEW